GRSTPPRGMPRPAPGMPPPRATPPPSPPLGMPAYPGHTARDLDYPGPDDPVDYYAGPADGDDEPGRDDTQYEHDRHLDAEDDDAGELAEEDVPEWPAEEECGPGPGWGYRQPDASRRGWAR